MVELQSVFKKAYWTLAAGGLAYVLFVCALTWPEVQRLYVSLVSGVCSMADQRAVLSTPTRSTPVSGRMWIKSSNLDS